VSLSLSLSLSLACVYVRADQCASFHSLVRVIRDFVAASVLPASRVPCSFPEERNLPGIASDSSHRHVQSIVAIVVASDKCVRSARSARIDADCRIDARFPRASFPIFFDDSKEKKGRRRGREESSFLIRTNSDNASLINDSCSLSSLPRPPSRAKLFQLSRKDFITRSLDSGTGM
jgi:hypothetical protein